MFYAALIGTAGLTLGLYAGKRRANGKGWGEIAGEMCQSAWSIVACAWRKIHAQFKKDDPNVVDAEVVDPKD